MSAQLRPHSARRLLACAAVGLAALTWTGCTQSSDGQSGKGAGAADATGAATKELAAAAEAMAGLRSFRFDSKITTGSSVTTSAGEFVSPDRVHQTVTVAGAAPVETVFIGARAWVKDKSGMWQGRPSPTAAESDPRSSFRFLTRARSVTKTGSVYRFAMRGSDTLVRSVANGADLEVEVTIDDGKVTVLSYKTTGDSPRVDVTIEYRDHGADITVEAPAA